MKLSRSIKSVIAVASVLVLLAAGLVIGKNILLSQVRKKIQSTFGYARLRLTVVPPALILDEVRSLTLTPFFSARRVTIEISYASLLSRIKPLTIFIDQPVLRLNEEALSGGKGSKPNSLFPLPFAIERGLIRGGEVFFSGKERNFQSRGLKAVFRQIEDTLSLQAEAEENTLSLGAGPKRLQGKLSLWVEGKGREIQIKKATFSGQDFALRAAGLLTRPDNPRLKLRTWIRVPVPLIIDLFDLPFVWEGKVEGEGDFVSEQGKIVFDANLTCPHLVLNTIPLGAVRGRVHMEENSKGRVELEIMKGGLPEEFISLDFEGPKVLGAARRVHLDPILKYAELPCPVKSPVWGDFTLIDGRLEAEGEFRDESTVPIQNKYPFRGKFKFGWDGKTGFSFSSPELHSSFADVSLEGRIDTEKDLAIDIHGEVTDVRQAREFTSLILQTKFDIPEIRGRGLADIRIFGAFILPRVTADFSLSPGGYDRFDAGSVEGAAEFIGDDFLGRFRVRDRFFRGELGLIGKGNDLKVDIQLDEGDVEKILPGLDIQLPLEGRGSGKFEINLIKEDLLVSGDFSSPVLRFLGQPLTEVKGRLEVRNDTVSFPGLQFKLLEGDVRGSGRLNLIKQEYGLDVKADKVNLTAVVPGAQGDLAFDLKGGGAFDRDLASGAFVIKGLNLPPFQKTEVAGGLRAGFSLDKINLEVNGNILPGENGFHVSFLLPLDGKPYTANLKGSFGNLDLLLPWKGSKGRLNYLAEIRDHNGAAQVNGVIDFQGSLLPLPKFAHALDDYSGLVFIQNNKASVRSFQAKLGGGEIKASGDILLGKGGVETLDLRADGKNMLLSPFERSRALTDGSLRLIKDPRLFLLEGDLFVQKMSWRREVYEKFGFFSSPYYQTRAEPTFFDDLTLNLRLKADDNAWMENSLGRIRGRFDLAITGSVNAPLVLGDIEALAGDVIFQDRRFKILKGRLNFFNPTTAEPYLEFKGESFVKDYRVTFTLNGLISQLRPEFSSSPPLPPEDVLALLALGESFKRTYSYDTSTQLSTASLLSFQIAEQAKIRAEGLFSLDRFRIDPFVLGASAEMTARLTVGKKISRNLFILYSTNLTTQREEIVRMEWEISNDFSLVGTRDEIGRVSVDVKVRKRF